jgi:phosphoglycolate phosphatase-like HAD superfamily hydrolase
LVGVERAAPLPGAGALLDALAARPGIAIAIVTSNSSRAVWRWLQRHRHTARLRAVVGRDSMLALKPAPAMVERALALCASVAGEAVFVGDSEADVGAAAAAGVGFLGIAASPAAHTRLAAAGVRDIFASPAALADYLKLESG